MAISINGTTGISGIDGSASSPAVRGIDDNTGISFGTDTAAISTAGSDRLTIDANGQVGIGATAAALLDIGGNCATNIVALGTDVFTVDCSQGNYFTQTTTATNTFSFTNIPSSRSFSFVLELTHNAGTISWPTSVKWPADTAPSLTTGKTHVFVFTSYNNGTRWRGASLVDYVN